MMRRRSSPGKGSAAIRSTETRTRCACSRSRRRIPMLHIKTSPRTVTVYAEPSVREARPVGQRSIMLPPCAGLADCCNAFAGPPCYRSQARRLADAMGLFFFIVGVLAGIALLVLLPLLIAGLGVVLAITLVIALPVIVAVLILIGLIALAPAVGYGLAIAALLMALWLSDPKRRHLPWRGPSGR